MYCRQFVCTPALEYGTEYKRRKKLIQHVNGAVHMQGIHRKHPCFYQAFLYEYNSCFLQKKITVYKEIMAAQDCQIHFFSPERTAKTCPEIIY